jgi:D-alanyl-D-alanine carboxypeptidase (penicillin-binding protein 5/6)
MNERAKSLGLTGTSFANATGFDSTEQFSTARDVANLATFALHIPELRARLSLSNAAVTSREGTRIVLEQTHQLLKTDTPVIAGKTGTTDAAGQCLMSVVREKDRDYLVVLLASRERYRDMQILLSVLASLLA